MNIFVVDDEPDILRLYSIYLNMRGDNVTLTSNSVEALEIIKKNDFDLVITDKRMPEVTGLEIIHFIENNKSSIPILLITGDHDVEHDFINNQSKVIIKPIFREDFIFEVDKIESNLEKINESIFSQN
jgi:DNA-binding NtrC family response regulator